MIAYLNGILLEVGQNTIILSVNGVGYEVYLAQRNIAQLPEVGHALKIRITSIVREDAFHLYGFTDAFDQKLFALLISVSGIGPKQALHMLSTADAGELAGAIARKDVGFLKSLKGVGQKTAEKVAVELHQNVSKLMKFESRETPTHIRSQFDDVAAALQQLGYRRAQIDDVIAKLPNDPPLSAEESVRAALKILGKAANNVLRSP